MVRGDVVFDMDEESYGVVNDVRRNPLYEGTESTTPIIAVIVLDSDTTDTSQQVASIARDANGTYCDIIWKTTAPLMFIRHARVLPTNKPSAWDLYEDRWRRREQLGPYTPPEPTDDSDSDWDSDSGSDDETDSKMSSAVYRYHCIDRSDVLFIMVLNQRDMQNKELETAHAIQVAVSLD